MIKARRSWVAAAVARQTRLWHFLRGQSLLFLVYWLGIFEVRTIRACFGTNRFCAFVQSLFRFFLSLLRLLAFIFDTLMISGNHVTTTGLLIIIAIEASLDLARLSVTTLIGLVMLLSTWIARAKLNTLTTHRSKWEGSGWEINSD